MPIDYVPYFPQPIEGQAVLNAFTRTRRLLTYRDNDKALRRIARGMPRFELETVETVGAAPQNAENLVIRGECLSACAYLKEQGLKVDLVYIDPPFASGADYAKKIVIRRNPKLASAHSKAEEEIPDDQLRSFDEKMYGDIWSKGDYLNWMYENLMAIKAIMSENASIYIHTDWHVGHYVKILMDEVFGEDSFRNEIYWYYYNKMHDVRKPMFPRTTDSILFYTKNRDDTPVFHLQREKRKETVRQLVRKKLKGKMVNARDENGNVLYRETDERIIDNVWRIPMLQPADRAEPLDYATQKPEELLERIISTSSDKGMIVADFFGGSGVTAAVAQRLGRKFIHADVGINSIQTARDRLVAAGAAFSVLEVKDGVELFRNPVQTMDKLRSLVTGLRLDEAELDKFWAGALNDSRLGLVPVYLPDLKDHTAKVLDIPLMNRIMNVAMPELPDKVKKVVVYYVDIEDPAALKDFMRDNENPERPVELRDLKELLSEAVAADEVTVTVKERTIAFESFHSDRLQQKLAAYNARHGVNQFPGGKLIDDEGNVPEPEPVKGFKPIEISAEGLELIEWVGVDCTAGEGAWHSDAEIKIDKRGFVTRDGKKTKEFWDGTLVCPKKPLRVKVRSIAGDETVVSLAAKKEEKPKAKAGKKDPKKSR